VVVFTMFAAESFDPRLIWDGLVDERDDQTIDRVIEGVGNSDGR
jgi:hypothetical protein